MFKSFDDLPEEFRDELLARHHHHGKDDPECKEDGIFYTEKSVIDIVNAAIAYENIRMKRWIKQVADAISPHPCGFPQSIENNKEGGESNEEI